MGSDGSAVIVDDLLELLGDEAGAADEAAVNLGLAHELACVLVVHAAAVEDADIIGCVAEDLTDGATDGGDGAVGILRCGGHAGADGPDRLIGDNNVLQVFGGHAKQSGNGLAANDLFGDARFARLKGLTNPDDGLESGGEGSALLMDPDKAYKLMDAVKRSTCLPVTVKTRLGYDENSMNAPELGKAAQELGLRWIAFHGRTRQQMYSGTADYEAIARLKSELRIPVIANGDLFSPADAVRMRDVTHADGFMIGRGCMGNPWLFRTARQALEGRPIEAETLLERIDTAILQTEWMVQFKGERLGVVEMRKHVGHYINGLRGATAIRRKVNLMTTLDEMKGLLLELRETATEEDV